jgi:hypothetical protein
VTTAAKPARSFGESIRINPKEPRMTTLAAPADRPFQIVFDNEDVALHNIAICRAAPTADKVFGEEPFSGPGGVVCEVPALGSGTYFIRCDVHPDMSGSLMVG